MSSSSPFHDGESTVQERLGVREQIEPWAKRVIRPFLPDEHREFYQQLPFLVVAARDRQDRSWATLLSGQPGFAHAPSAKRLAIESSPLPGDALEDAFQDGADIGILGIELSSRRRNRVNGRLVGNDKGRLQLEVVQSFGNCPQHIRPREVVADAALSSQVPAQTMRELSTAAEAIIRQADTLFLASGHRGDGDSAAFGMDASHRGGSPGFVSVESRNHLRIPDFSGNNHFNTLGNLLVNPSIGLLFIDFASGALLQISGTATIDWTPQTNNHDAGAPVQRYIDVAVDAVVLHGAAGVRWAEDATNTLDLTIAAREHESEDVCSFILTPTHGESLPPFRAGQHLPVIVPSRAHQTPLMRTYSLSASPAENHYRISVKRVVNGEVSNQLHDHYHEGDVLKALAPAGDFVLADSARPIVLIAAGVGATPLLSMAHESTQLQPHRETHFFIVARNDAHFSFTDELSAWATSASSNHLHVWLTQPESRVLSERVGDLRQGRIDSSAIAEILTSLDNDYYLCGPAPFMAELQGGLEDLGVPAEQIYSESFGGS